MHTNGACHNNYANSSHTTLSWSCVVKWIFVDKGRGVYSFQSAREESYMCVFRSFSNNATQIKNARLSVSYCVAFDYLK